MSRVFRVSIAFDTLPDQDDWYAEMSDEELGDYLKECFYEDILTLYNNNELYEVINLEVIDLEL